MQMQGELDRRAASKVIHGEKILMLTSYMQGFFQNKEVSTNSQVAKYFVGR